MFKVLKDRELKRAKKGNNSYHPFASISKSIEEITSLESTLNNDFYELNTKAEWMPEKTIQPLFTYTYKRKAMKTSGAVGRLRHFSFKAHDHE